MKALRFLVLLLWGLSFSLRAEEAKPEKAPKAQAPEADMPSNEPRASDALPEPVKVDQRDALNLTQYRPLYALYGNPSTKVQVSFKYQIVRQVPLYVTYTQIMFWKLREESIPFADISFNPELVYRFSFEGRKYLESIDLIPYGHKSNGKTNQDSRSTEYSAIQFNLRRDFANWPVKAAVRLRTFYFLDKTNDDLRKYEGPLELQFSVGRYGNGFFDKVELATRVFPGGTWGTRWDRGGEEFSLVFRILGVDLTPAFYLQYFYGYAESLINYNQKQSHFRVGFLL